MDALTYAGLWQVCDLFCARFDAYVKDSRAHVNGDVSPELLVDAYSNKWAISGYTAKAEGTDLVTHVGAIDFDHATQEQRVAVRATLTSLGIPWFISMSRRGAHVWVFLQEDVPAQAMNKALEQAIRLTDKDILSTCEVFPKRSSAPFGVGALRLPLMTHPKDGQRYPCYDMDGNRITKLIDVVTSIKYADASKIRALAADAPVEYPRGLGAYAKPRVDSAGSAVSLLANMGVTAVPGHSCRCPFHEDRKASLSVSGDDQRVWCKSPECVAYNGGRGVGTLALQRMVQP